MSAGRVPGVIRSAAGGLTGVVHNPDIRRLEASWTLGVGADLCFLVVVLLAAYQASGALGVGLLGIVRLGPGTLVALLANPEGRMRPERLLVWVSLVRAAAAAAAVGNLAVDGPVWVTFLTAGVVATSGVLVRPTQAALGPSLATSPAELVASNVAASLGEGAGTFAGPLLAGIALAFAGDAFAAALAALGFAMAALAAAGIRVSPAARTAPHGPHAGVPFVAGLRLLARRPSVALVIGSLGGQVLVRGLLTTLIVVASIELLDLGEPGVGLLNAAIGAGGLIGALAALALAGGSRLAPAFALALVGWGLPIAAIGVVPSDAIAILALVLVGTSNALLDVAAYTLLQGTVPSGERSALFALIEAVVGLGIMVGGLLAPLLVSALGIRGAFVVGGAILPTIAVLGWRRLRRIDDEVVVPERQARLLRNVPLFRLLPLAAVERLAADVEPMRFGPGQDLMRQGELGEHYYVVASGSVEVSQDGAPIGRYGPGEGLGEIALLRSVPRTATVTALEPTEAFAFGAPTFIAAVTGHEDSSVAAEQVIGDRLGTGSSS